MPNGGLTAAMAGSVLLQAAHAAHDQRGFHTVQECDPFLLPGELHFLPGSLQPQGAHPQISQGAGEMWRVSVMPGAHNYINTGWV